MEQKRIGEFIAERRKAKQMTQKQLGEALGISDKTVSKWECGKGLPDISMIMPLCELLEINVNELLSGEHLTQDMYTERAEENIMNLMKDNEKQKKKKGVKDVLSNFVWLFGIMLFLVYLPTVTAGGISLIGYWDRNGFVEVAFIMVFSLCFAGRFGDFINAFVLLFRQSDNPGKLEDAIAAVSLAEKALVFSGAFCSIFYIIYILYHKDITGDFKVFALQMGVALITLLYGMFGAIILTPVKARLEKKKFS